MVCLSALRVRKHDLQKVVAGGFGMAESNHANQANHAQPYQRKRNI